MKQRMAAQYKVEGINIYNFEARSKRARMT